MRRTILAAAVTALVATAATAGAADLITGQRVKDNSLTGQDVKNIRSGDIRDGSLTLRDLTPSLREQLLRANRPGIQGPHGLAGVAGPKGDVGAQGERGATGATGARGAAGADSTVPGPRGPQGDTGARGVQGERGATGATGTAGAQGRPPTSAEVLAAVQECLRTQCWRRR